MMRTIVAELPRYNDKIPSLAMDRFRNLKAALVEYGIELWQMKQIENKIWFE